MAITLKQLCLYAKENYHMEIISSKSNMNQTVDWVHILEDPETANFLHGYELIFTTGIGQRNTSWFLSFAKELIEHKASGLVLNIGPYIKGIPDDLKQYCDEMQFPLFTIPWETRIVDITNDFCHRIIDAEKNEVSVSEAFRKIVFFPEKFSEYRGVLEQNAFDLDAEYMVMTISAGDGFEDRFVNNEKQIRNMMMNLLFENGEHFNIFKQDKMLVVVLQRYSRHALEQTVKRFISHMQLMYAELPINIGLSESETSIKNIGLLFKRALAVMKMASKQEIPYLSYDAIGMYQLLIEIEDNHVMKRYYEQTLGLLEDYDRKNQTDYILLLKSYLDYNNSVDKVSKALFVHRNTINYKIKKIKEILQCDLDYQDGVRLMLAYKIKEYLG